MPPRNAASLISLYVHGFDSWQARTRLRNLDVWAEAVAEREQTNHLLAWCNPLGNPLALIIRHEICRPANHPTSGRGGCTPFYNQHIIHPASKPLSNTHKIILPRRRQCPTSIASDLCPRLLPYPALDSCCCFSVNPPRMLHILLMYPTQHLSHLSLLHSTMIDDRSAHRVWLMFAHKHTYT